MYTQGHWQHMATEEQSEGKLVCLRQENSCGTLMAMLRYSAVPYCISELQPQPIQSFPTCGCVLLARAFLTVKRCCQVITLTMTTELTGRHKQVPLIDAHSNGLRSEPQLTCASDLVCFQSSPGGLDVYHRHTGVPKLNHGQYRGLSQFYSQPKTEPGAG